MIIVFLAAVVFTTVAGGATCDPADPESDSPGPFLGPAEKLCLENKIELIAEGNRRFCACRNNSVADSPSTCVAPATCYNVGCARRKVIADAETYGAMSFDTTSPRCSAISGKITDVNTTTSGCWLWVCADTNVKACATRSTACDGMMGTLNFWRNKSACGNFTSHSLRYQHVANLTVFGLLKAQIGRVLSAHPDDVLVLLTDTSFVCVNVFGVQMSGASITAALAADEAFMKMYVRAPCVPPVPVVAILSAVCSATLNATAGFLTYRATIPSDASDVVIAQYVLQYAMRASTCREGMAILNVGTGSRIRAGCCEQPPSPSCEAVALEWDIVTGLRVPFLRLTLRSSSSFVSVSDQALLVAALASKLSVSPSDIVAVVVVPGTVNVAFRTAQNMPDTMLFLTSDNAFMARNAIVGVAVVTTPGITEPAPQTVAATTPVPVVPTPVPPPPPTTATPTPPPRATAPTNTPQALAQTEIPSTATVTEPSTLYFQVGVGATLGVVAVIAAVGTYLVCTRQNKSMLGLEPADDASGSYLGPGEPTGDAYVRSYVPPSDISTQKAVPMVVPRAPFVPMNSSISIVNQDPLDVSL